MGVIVCEVCLRPDNIVGVGAAPWGPMSIMWCAPCISVGAAPAWVNDYMKELGSDERFWTYNQDTGFYESENGQEVTREFVLEKTGPIDKEEKPLARREIVEGIFQAFGDEE